jgi:preprotein translocase subunit SecB
MEKKSSFQFLGYKVVKSLIEINGVGSKDLELQFEPKGILNNTNDIFTLEMKIQIFDMDKNINIEVIFESEYKVGERDDNLNGFLLSSAPAILFPYIRAYITALTALSGIPSIVLPTMNLSGLEGKLAENLAEIN